MSAWRDGEAEPSGADEPVEDELREPLLVDPLPSGRDHRQRLTVGQPVLDDLPARGQRQPRVDAEQVPPDYEHEGEDNEPCDYEQVVGEKRAS